MAPEEAGGALAPDVDRLSHAFTSLDQAVFILDGSRWTILDANRAAERIFAAPRGELLGTPLRELHVGDEAFGAVRREGTEALGSGGEHRTECLMRRTAGATFEAEHFLGALDPVDPGGERQVLCAVRDISVRKELERRLLHAEKLEAVGRLAGSVAHDFNNLVTVIRANMELMAADPDLAPGLREYADEVLAASRRAAYLTRHLLAFSRRQTLNPRPVILNEVLEEIAPLVGRLIGEDVALDLGLAPGLPPVEVDPGQIEQVVMNLAANAREAMPQGGDLFISTGTSELTAGDGRFRGARPGPHVLLVVRDTGKGMQPSVRERAFEPFFTTKGGKGGTGLGLASVQGVVGRSGGGIALESSPGKGTTVTLCFPVSDAVPERNAAPARAEPAPGGGETVMVVEDDPAVRRVVERILVREGYRVITAETAEDAHAMVTDAGERVDLLLTDLVLPGATGLELVASLQAKVPGLRVLVMSGYSGDRMHHDRIRELDLPLLTKPFTPETLVARVGEMLAPDMET